MVRCDRFVIEGRFKNIPCGEDYIETYVPSPVIYDRVERKDIVSFDTGNVKLDNELAEAVLTMVNIKYMGVKE